MIKPFSSLVWALASTINYEGVVKKKGVGFRATVRVTSMDGEIEDGWSEFFGLILFWTRLTKSFNITELMDGI